MMNNRNEKTTCKNLKNYFADARFHFIVTADYINTIKSKRIFEIMFQLKLRLVYPNISPLHLIKILHKFPTA